MHPAVQIIHQLTVDLLILILILILSKQVELPSRIKCQFCVGTFTLLRKAVEHMQEKHAIDYQRLQERLHLEKNQENAPAAANKNDAQKDHTYAYEMMLHKARFAKDNGGEEGVVAVKDDPDADDVEVEDKMQPLSDGEGEEEDEEMEEGEEDGEFVKIKDEPTSDEEESGATGGSTGDDVSVKDEK